MIAKPRPHYNKLRELASNPKLPGSDLERVKHFLDTEYPSWIEAMTSVTSSGDVKVSELVGLLNAYKLKVELDLIWDSSDDFLFRQRGQIKLDNSIIEEFLPWLVDPDIIDGFDTKAITSGPRRSFAATYFTASLQRWISGGGLNVRRKDQDFTVGRTVHLWAADSADPSDGEAMHEEVYLAFIAAECKTNLDKTMFQEASATAHDLKVAVPSSQYFLVCEWLDMTPISTVGTDISEVIVLRGKRLASNKRMHYSTYEGRVEHRAEYEGYLTTNPVREKAVLRLVDHIRAAFKGDDLNEEDVIERGYF